VVETVVDVVVDVVVEVVVEVAVVVEVDGGKVVVTVVVPQLASTIDNRSNTEIARVIHLVFLFT